MQGTMLCKHRRERRGGVGGRTWRRSVRVPQYHFQASRDSTMAQYSK